MHASGVERAIKKQVQVPEIIFAALNPVTRIEEFPMPSITVDVTDGLSFPFPPLYVAVPTP